MNKVDLGIIAAIIAFLFSIPLIVEAECNAKTEGMGFNVKWSFLGGCKIEHQEGKWIPLERYRFIEE